MKYSMNSVVFLFALCQAAVNGFTNHLPRQTFSPRSTNGKSLLSTNTGTEPVVDTDQQTVAISALEKLRARQKAELEETEQLLNSLTTDINSIFDGANGPHNDAAPASIAASLASGKDYGFISRSEGATSEQQGGGNIPGYGPPSNIWSLGTQQFRRNWNAIRGEYSDEQDVRLTPAQTELRSKLKELTLNSTAIWERETAHGPIEAPLIIKIPYILLCYLLDVVFEGRYVFSRFFLLETVARMPYFSYITMLHLYETLGFWRRSSDIKRIHFAEEWNEYHHLLIMESLGGDQTWWVRFVAQHSALVYYVVLCHLWAISPTLAYKFSDLLETHAVNTYGQLLDENEDKLQDLPPSMAAVEYYTVGASDPFFGEYQTTALSSGGDIRSPGYNMTTLYDVFSAIRADEGDHVSTMKACLDPNVAVNSASLEKKLLFGTALVAGVAYFVSTGEILDLDGDVLSGAVAGEILDDGAASTTMMETAIAAAVGLAQQFVQDEEEGDLVGVTTDLVETGAFGAGLKGLQEAIVKFIEFVVASLV
mmetsp:Transcript_14328/g.22368  ORF Transcript_14328/g.22368 Transcript_14328/m.22368 type:complete len:537 (-) Transcript_14328:200-1810(-)|eukprot:CAMPEP_0195296514 /NCGR_PEP_ID=MMETSP0707-20130614/19659_1 /TAXON_ID=33640 /ORGANISM="Asterionellopsis glacialis, Strain CCMP134" /LENGTH=536 /DNA_ID=CAMNT_0040358047 /DNA_START=186 /DNA_END=1796 /DNA_ORIENTATION=+